MKIFRNGIKGRAIIAGVLAWMMILGWATTQSVAGTGGKSSDTIPGFSDTLRNVSVAFKGKKVITTRKKSIILKGSIKPKSTKAKVFYTLKSPSGKQFKAKGSSKAWVITLKNLRLGKTKVYIFAATAKKASKPILIVVKRIK